MTRRWLGLSLVAALILSACAAPERQYVNAGSTGMYFVLPASWSSVGERTLQRAQGAWNDDAGSVFAQTVQWQRGWSAGEVGAAPIFAATAPRQPAVFAFVRDLLPVERQGIGSSVNLALRDVVLPATALLDAGTEVQTERTSSGAFEGLHQFATFIAGGRRQTVEVVSMLAPGKDRVYVLMIRCTERCFSDNSGTINAVFDSLTFKETHGQ